MAKVNVYPLSINGVKPPLNLLDRLFGDPIDQSNLLYPLDLQSNPIYNHAVQFQIFDYEYGISDVIRGNNGGTLQSSSDAGTAVQSLKSDPWGTVSDWLKNLKPRRGATQTTISLYMPDDVNTQFNSDYMDISLTDTLGAASYLGSLVSDMAASKNRTNFGSKGNPANMALGGGVETILNKFKPNLGTLVSSRFLNQVVNPQLQLLYKGIELREPQFTFIFSPNSRKEAQSVEQIIKKFVYHSLPGVIGLDAGQYLEPPQIFEIKFAFTGGNSLYSSVSNYFKNLGINILGGDWFNSPGSQSDKIFTAPDARIFKIGHCVLKNVSVNYTPNGWATYEDGYPVQIQLNLHFKELEIQSKNKIDNQTWQKHWDDSYTGTPSDQMDGPMIPNGAGDY
jgi:hypothetical protein